MNPIDRVVFGCVELSAMRTRKEAFRLLEDVVDAGIRHFDTARLYGRGFSERLLGEFLRWHGPGLEVTTKAGLGSANTPSIPTWFALPLNYALSTSGRRRASATQAAGPGIPEVAVRRETINRDVLEASVAESLKQLGLEKVECLLLHEALPEQLSPGAWEFLDSARADGVFRRLGLGTRRAVLEREYAGDPRIEVLQYEGSDDGGSLLTSRFPGALHVHHSILRGATVGTHGEAMQLALERNPAGRVIFSTRSRQHLRANLRGLE